MQYIRGTVVGLAYVLILLGSAQAQSGSTSGPPPSLLSAFSLAQQTELIYIGYFNRSADAGGFTFWERQDATAQAQGQTASQALTNIANSFAPQPETEALYPLLGSTTLNFNNPSVQAEVTTFIESVYSNLFDRTADSGGLAYWMRQIESGEVGLGMAVLAIANGAQGPDATILQNKITVASDFTNLTAATNLPTNSALLAEAKTILAGIDGNSLNDASVTTAEALIPQWISSQTNDPTVGVLPSYNDAYTNWKNAGMQSVGGIPNRTTVCATVNNPLGGGQDDFTNIQNAINSCPAGEYVQLGAGAFTVHMADLPIHISTGIVLRGTGNCTGSGSPYCQTSITVSDGALAYTGGKCGTNTSNEVACPNGGPSMLVMSPVSAYGWSWAQCGNSSTVASSCGATPLDVDASQGQTTIQVHSLTNFSVGQWVLIDEASGAGWVNDPMGSGSQGCGQLWAASDWLSASGSPATGRVMWSKGSACYWGNWDFGSGVYPYTAGSPGCWFSFCDRVTAELHKIASIGAGPCPGTNCTLTFDDPLTVAFRESGSHNAQVYLPYGTQNGSGSTIPLLTYAGVENLSLLRSPQGGLNMHFCVYCWAKNVEVGDWYGGGIKIDYSARSQLDTVYVHHCWDSVDNGGEYPLSIDSASTELLITNSITNFAGKGMVARAGGAGSVVSYNYQDDTMYDAESGIGDYWVDQGLNATHYSGPHHVLFEGNWGDNLDGDPSHGNSMYITFFRNQGSGLRTRFTDPSIPPSGGTVDDSTGTGYYCYGAAVCSANKPAPLRAAGPSAYNYWYGFVGNVLGTAGKTTAANGWTYSGDFTASRIWMTGYQTGNGGVDPNLGGVTGAYIFRNGNYDYLHNSILDWTSGYSHTLPNSFYLSGKPSFFSAGASCTYPWPWVTPTGSSPVQTNGCGGDGLPAKARWDAGTPFVQP